MQTVKVIGGGLAGCECAYQLAIRGIEVELYEMRPDVQTPAHKTGALCELVCSNSLKSTDENTAQGLLKYELNAMGSMVLREAKLCSVPAGGALAVDRNIFSQRIENELLKFPNIKIIREEVTDFSDFTVIATGPLTSDKLSLRIGEILGGEKLFFFDAAAPVVTAESVDYSKAFWAGRYGRGGADYLNCPMNKTEYGNFVDNLISADKIEIKDFEKRFFNACSPVERIAETGRESLRFGPMRPVGLTDPESGLRPYAAVQLRTEDNMNSCFNIVGFQTNLKFSEQKRVFGLIPALKDAEYARYGVMHRNTYINSPKVLTPYFNLKTDKTIFFAGQITGVEGYLESVMSGLMCAINIERILRGESEIIPPETTMTGGLMRYVSAESKDFQPMHASFNLVPELDERMKDKLKRKEAYSLRARLAVDEFVKTEKING